MGKSKAANPNQKAKNSSGSPLKKHFGRLRDKTSVEADKQSSSSSNNSTADPPRKVLTATFLTYIQSALKARSAESVQQAQTIHEAHGKLSADAKNQWLQNFLKLAGRNQGCAACMSSAFVLIKSAKTKAGQATSLVGFSWTCSRYASSSQLG